MTKTLVAYFSASGMTARLAKTLAERFLSSADQNRELLVSLVERVEFSEDKQLYIHFRFPSLEAIL